MKVMNTVKQQKKSMSSSRSASGLQDMEFSLFAPDTKNICLVGQFNDWNAESAPLINSKDGTRKIQMKRPLGKYENKYFVDGSWSLDTSNTETIANSFGTINCIISAH